MVTKEDVLEALGVEMTREDRFWTGMLVGVGVGALVGGVLALLLTPRSGSELRQVIGDRGRAVGERLRGRYGGAPSDETSGTSAPMPST